MRTRNGKLATDVVIIGGGFSGALCALHLSAAHPDLQISIIERGPRLGPGLEPPFETWLRETADPSLLTQALEESGGRLGDDFVPRHLFGDYFEDLVKRLLASGRTRWLRGDAVAFLDDRNAACCSPMDVRPRPERSYWRSATRHHRRRTARFPSCRTFLSMSAIPGRPRRLARSSLRTPLPLSAQALP